MTTHRRLKKRIRNSPWRQLRQYRNREHRHLFTDEAARYLARYRLQDRAFWPKGHRRPSGAART